MFIYFCFVTFGLNQEICVKISMKLSTGGSLMGLQVDTQLKTVTLPLPLLIRSQNFIRDWQSTISRSPSGPDYWQSPVQESTLLSALDCNGCDIQTRWHFVAVIICQSSYLPALKFFHNVPKALEWIA